MPARPYEGSGVLQQENDEWRIALESDVPPGTVSGTHVKIVYWQDQDAPSEYDTIASVQQLPLDVVAHGLRAEGALHEVRTEFMDRLARSMG